GLVQIGWLTGVYAMIWGLSQLWTGHLADRIGRKRPVVAGFFLLAGGIALTALGHGEGLWLPAAAIMGVGMALLYPNLIAAMSDRAPPFIRGKALVRTATGATRATPSARCFWARSRSSPTRRCRRSGSPRRSWPPRACGLLSRWRTLAV
ncbi:Major facilitator superfamily MFS-1, partial [mine drainage metagenome]